MLPSSGVTNTSLTYSARQTMAAGESCRAPTSVRRKTTSAGRRWTAWVGRGLTRPGWRPNKENQILSTSYSPTSAPCSAHPRKTTAQRYVYDLQPTASLHDKDESHVNCESDCNRLRANCAGSDMRQLRIFCRNLQLCSFSSEWRRGKIPPLPLPRRVSGRLLLGLLSALMKMLLTLLNGAGRRTAPFQRCQTETCWN